MKNLVLTALAVAVCVYVEEKYNVCDKVADQIRKFTDSNMFDDSENAEPIEDEV